MPSVSAPLPNSKRWRKYSGNCDAQTREIVLDMYIRKVEKRDGQLWNVEFDSIKALKDPGKSK